jgi:hypothetical protein
MIRKHDIPVVFLSKMAQAVSSMGPVQRLVGGIFVSNRASTLRFFSVNYPELKKTRYCRSLPHLTQAHRILSNARIIVSGAGHSAILKHYKAKKAMLFHGTFRALSPKSISVLARFDHIFLIGPRMERMLLRWGEKYPFSYSVSGYVPFVEFPEPTLDVRGDILLKLGLNPALPTIFYAPARRDCGSWLRCADGIAREIPRKYNLIIRPHPSQVFSQSRKERLFYKGICSILRDRENAIVDMASCSFPELLCIADLLISDATSPNEEFLFYSRPQIITETYPREKWRDQWLKEGLHPEDADGLMQLYSCGLSFSKGPFHHWGQAVEHCLENPDEYRGNRERYFHHAFGDRELSAAENVAEVLNQIIRLEEGQE